MTDEFFPNTFHLRSAGWTVSLLLRKRNDLVAGRNIFKEIRMCLSCFSLMFRNSDVIRKFLFPRRICFLLGFIKKIQLTIYIFPFFTGSTKELLREVFNLLTKVLFFQTVCFQCFCKDWISSVCTEIVLFSWLIMSLYARIFESFELPAICLLLLFHCSYYTIKSNEKEAENPVFTRGVRVGCSV